MYEFPFFLFNSKVQAIFLNFNSFSDILTQNEYLYNILLFSNKYFYVINYIKHNVNSCTVSSNLLRLLRELRLETVQLVRIWLLNGTKLYRDLISTRRLIDISICKRSNIIFTFFNFFLNRIQQGLAKETLTSVAFTGPEFSSSGNL